MSVVLLQTAAAYAGLSTDAKPADASVPVGATFTETDTGVVSLWNGSVWSRQLGGAMLLDTQSGIAAILLACLSELGKIRKMTAIASEIDDDELEPDSPMLS